MQETDLGQRTNLSRVQNATAWVDSHALHLMLGLYCLVALAFVFLGNTNRDEGWYLYASRLVYEGNIPYKDFPYFQMPLLPYIYGLPQLIFGPSILVGRLTSFALSLVTVGVGVHLAQRIAGRAVALLFLAFTIVNLHVMWTYTTTRTEPLVTPLAMLSLLFLLKQRRSTTDLVLAPSLMLWAAAARLTAAPAFLAVLAFSLYQVRKNRRQWNTILVVIGLQTLVLAVVPLILAGERMVFDIWTSQEFRSGQRTLAPPIGTVLRAKALFLTALLSWFPLVTILMLALGVFLFLRWRDGWRPSLAGLAEWPTAQLLMLALAAFLFLPHLALEALQPFYFVPAFPIVALMAASAIHRLGSVLSPRPEWMILPSLVAALLLIEGLTFASAFPDRINTADPHLLELREAAKYLKSAVPSEKRVVTFDTSVVLEANRRVANGLEMAQFSFWPGFKTSDARHYGVVNHEILRELVASDDTGAVVFSDMDQIVIASTNPYPAPPDAEQRELLSYEVFPELEEEYRLAKEFSHFGQFGDTLYILVRTD